MRNLIAVALIGLMGSVTFAHEGHDAAPGALKATHGGVVKAGKEINLEYVVSGTEVKLYPVSHDGGDIPASKVELSGTAKSIKGKEEPLKLSPQAGAYVAQVDFKGAYRVELKVTANVAGNKETFKFQVEK